MYLNILRLSALSVIVIILSGLEGLKNLEYLYLDYSSIDSSFLYNVGVMSSLRVLSLRSAVHNASLPDRGICTFNRFPLVRTYTVCIWLKLIDFSTSLLLFHRLV